MPSSPVLAPGTGDAPLSRRRLLRLGIGLSAVGLAGPVLAACAPAPPTPQVVERVVEKPVEKVVEKVVTQVVEKPVERVVTQVVEKDRPVVVTATPSARGPVTLEVWLQEYAQPQILDEMHRKWRELYPSVKLNAVTVPFADQETKVLTGLAGGLTPDSIMSHPLRTATYATKGVTRPLDDYIKSSGMDVGDYFSLGYFTWAGKLYSLTDGEYPWVYYYNKELTQAAGAGDPAELYRKGEFGSARFSEMAAKITRGEGKDKVFGLRAGNPSLTVMCAWIFGFDGKVFADDNRTCTLTDDNTVKAIQYMADWSLKGWAPGDVDTQGVQGGLTGLFNANRLGFLPRGRAPRDFFKVGDRLAMVPMETFPGGRKSARNGPNGMTLISKSKSPDEAFNWVRFDGTLFNEILVATGESIPNRLSLLKTKAWKDQLYPWEDAAFWEATMQNMRPFVPPPGMAEIDRLFGTAWEKIVLKKAGVPEALTEAKAQIDAVLKETMK